MNQARLTYSVMLLLVGVSVSISSGEYLAIRREYLPRGAFAWRVMSSRPTVITRPRLRARLAALFSYRGSLGLHVVRLVGALALVVLVFCGDGERTFLAGAIWTVFLASLALSFRDIVGTDGSDQMTLVIMGSAAIGSLAGGDFSTRAVLSFVGAQAVMSYTVSGVAKLVSPRWRRQPTVSRILNTRTYGLERTARVLTRHPTWDRLLAWGIILFETGFGLAVLLLPSAGFVWFLVLSALFHLAIAAVMGLNTFFWSFVAAYPALYYINGQVIGGSSQPVFRASLIVLLIVTSGAMIAEALSGRHLLKDARPEDRPLRRMHRFHSKEVVEHGQ